MCFVILSLGSFDLCLLTVVFLVFIVGFAVRWAFVCVGLSVFVVCVLLFVAY